MSQSLPQLEEEALKFWQENQIFEKSVKSRPADRHYVFYDGPPFATGLPHYGQLLGSTIKDVIGRYWTMKGYRVERVWGWDCHGLPIENMIEKELRIKGGKKGIESLGVAEFNQACRAAVLRLDKEWRKIIHRLGRWVDMEHSYKTMDNSYIESVWWGFKKLWENDLVYQGRRVILYCPRCATPLSDFEIAMDKSYREVEDDSVFVKFRVLTNNQELRTNDYLLAWTTTPWTLPGNVALAVDETADYLRLKVKGEILIVAKKRLEIIKEPYEIIDEFKGSAMVGQAYEPLFPDLPIGQKKAHYVVGAGFVSLEEGTGIVHTAAIYGEDDYQLAVKIGLPTIPMLDDEGKFLPFVKIASGKFFKEADPIITEDLERRGLVYLSGKIVHSYPFCYRCEAPLFYNAVPAWFIDIQKIKAALLRQNEEINWFPPHFKHGQFQDIIESSPDWNISRSRYWGSPMPIWVCSSCGQKEIIGSVRELRSRAANSELITNNFDLHRPGIDEIKLKCHCGGESQRITEVFDCWLESASMPFAAKHYPFENKEWFEANYPADFIAEYSGQVRAWFNVLHRVSVAIFGKPSFKNVAVTGVYLGVDGRKMSKSLGNYPDPMVVAQKYGVDALRFYMMASPVMKAEDVIFDERGVAEARNQFVNLFYHSYQFLRLYRAGSLVQDWPSALMALNRWLVLRTEQEVTEVTRLLDSYNTVEVCQRLRAYVSDLSTWYLRRSRDLLRSKDAESLQVLAVALMKLSKLASPITPFMAELVYRDLSGEESVHLAAWPEKEELLPSGEARHESRLAQDLFAEMNVVRKICELGHAARKAKGIKVRQPLSLVKVVSRRSRISNELAQLVLDELNVKGLRWEGHPEVELTVELSETITPELRAEGEARELVRQIQDLRKAVGCRPTASIKVFLPGWPKDWEDYIKRETLAKAMIVSESFRIEVLVN